MIRPPSKAALKKHSPMETFKFPTGHNPFRNIQWVIFKGNYDNHWLRNRHRLIVDGWFQCWVSQTGLQGTIFGCFSVALGCGFGSNFCCLCLGVLVEKSPRSLDNIQFTSWYLKKKNQSFNQAIRWVLFLEDPSNGMKVWNMFPIMSQTLCLKWGDTRYHQICNRLKHVGLFQSSCDRCHAYCCG